MNPNRIEKMKFRDVVLSGIRDSFSSRGYIEADVPVMSPGVIPEAPIELFRTEKVSPYCKPHNMYLLPSPEYYLKQLIAEGSGNIFSISHSFRNSEQTGAWHNPEFTMLEWYTMGAGYIDSIGTTEDFFDDILRIELPVSAHTGNPEPGSPKLAPPFRRMTVDEAFSSYTGFSLEAHCTGRLSTEKECADLRELAAKLGLSTDESYSWEELFNLIFVHQVEPNLPSDSPLVLYDYPSGIPALARDAKTEGRLQRWELYAGGIELANCYTEETDYRKVADFFEKESAEKESAIVPVSADFSWCELYKKEFPYCSGAALGADRLMMLLAGVKSIEGVILFPQSDIIGDL